jgi:hypothetical protein
LAKIIHIIVVAMDCKTVGKAIEDAGGGGGAVVPAVAALNDDGSDWRVFERVSKKAERQV